jgi:hypothetical protein
MAPFFLMLPALHRLLRRLNLTLLLLIALQSYP